MKDDKTLFMLLDRLCFYLVFEKSSINLGWIRLTELIGRSYLDCSKVRNTVLLLEEMVRIKLTLPEDHPSLLASQRNLAVYLWKFGRHYTALEMMYVVEIQKRILNNNQSSCISAEEWLQYFRRRACCEVANTVPYCSSSFYVSVEFYM